jgi:ubiquinone/menaquinone biosynthesis C-methylase UbiE
MMESTVASSKVDYDKLAGTYNARYQAKPLRGVAEALCELARRRPARRMLEVGCGTGHWLCGWPAGVWSVGLDRSRRMLEQAPAEFPRVQGDANRLPFAAAAFDLLYVVNALHHFDDPRGFVREAAAAIAPGGILAIVTLEPRQLRHRWYLYDYFPGVWEMDLARFPALAEIAGWMAQEGLTAVECRVVERITDHQRGRAIFDSPFLAKDACSQFALLPPEAYQEGLRRIETACRAAEDADREIVFPTELALHLVSGEKP